MNGCGGSLIAPDVVMSAAHCGDYTGDSVFVGAVRYQVAKQVMHPAYDNNTEENDVMVLKLASPVTGSTSVELVLNDEYSIPANGNDLTVLGLGDLFEDGPAPTTLMDVVVQAIDTDQCNSRDSYDGDVVDEVMLCAGEGTHGLIVSRVALFQNHHLITLSFSYPRCPRRRQGLLSWRLWRSHCQAHW
jgi:trypsin